MIFTPLADCTSPFKNSSLNAINLFAYICKTSKADCAANIGCNVKEFDVNTGLLDLSLYLHYGVDETIELERLTAFAGQIKQDLNESIEEDIEDFDIVTGIKLLYLVLANYSAFYYESLTEPQLQVLSQIESAMQSYILHFEFEAN